MGGAVKEAEDRQSVPCSMACRQPLGAGKDEEMDGPSEPPPECSLVDILILGFLTSKNYRDVKFVLF